MAKKKIETMDLFTIYQNGKNTNVFYPCRELLLKDLKITKQYLSERTRTYDTMNDIGLEIVKELVTVDEMLSLFDYDTDRQAMEWIFNKLEKNTIIE